MRIAVYGTSPITEKLLSDLENENVIGVLDGFLNHGTCYGKEIISLEKCSDLGTDVIIIAARRSSVRIVANRIKGYCLEHNIKLFDIDGTNLLEVGCFAAHNHEYYEVNKEALMHEIAVHGAISFDIFDTLLMRKTFFPQDVFYIIEKKAKDILHEKNFVESRLKYSRNPKLCLKEIYDFLMTELGLTANEAETLMHLEQEIDETLIIPRKSMKEIFEYAKKLNKPIYLVSDMYYSTEFIQKLLEKNGFSGFEKIYLSCEYKTSKKDNLFSYVKEDIGDFSLLHIGDDEDGDLLSPKRYGFTVFGILSAAAMLSISTYGKLIKPDNDYESKILIGMLISRIFNDPFSLYKSNGKPTIKSPYELGYCLLAPVISLFVIWLAKTAHDLDSEKIIFLSRDGYLLHKLYKKLKSTDSNRRLPESVYLLISRIACVSAAASDREKIDSAMDAPFEGALSDKLKVRFQLPDLYLSKDIVLNTDTYKTIIDNSQVLMRNFKNYINQLDIEFNDKTVVCDFAAAGTCQAYLESIVSSKSVGLYLLKFANKFGVDIIDFRTNEFSKQTATHFEDNYFLLEFAVSDTKPMVLKFDRDGRPIFSKNKLSLSQKKYVNDLQEGIYEYFCNYLSFTETYTENSLVTADEIFGFANSLYSDFTGNSLMQEPLFDEYTNRWYEVNL
jgi:FMN phosphatase YigB (HAD superfamily)